MLDIHLGLMVFVLGLFIALLILLNRFLFQPLLTFMDERERSIANDLEAAKQLNGNSEELVQKAQEVLNEAKAKAAAIKQKAVEDEKASAEKKLRTKEEELEKAYESFKSELSQRKEELKNELLSQMPLFKESLKAKFSSM